MNNKKNTEKGRIFEKEVVDLYEALNYNVEHNVELNGQQVDIYARKMIDGIGEMKLIIECKYLEKGNVSNQQVQNFIATICTLKQKDQSLIGVMVTNTDFSTSAKSASKDSITLLTLEQLEKDIFNFRHSFSNIVNDFETREIFSEFVPLEGVIDSGSKNINVHNFFYGIKQFDLIEKIENLTFDEWRKITFINILADYGSGKTTLLQRLNYLFAQQYIKGNHLKPIYLELKYFDKYKDLDSFLINSFIKLFQRAIPIETIYQKIKQGHFLFLLDGFDEMSPYVNRQTRVENLLKLSPILLSNSNAIMTCRPSYFVSQQEFSSAIDFVLKRNAPIDVEIKHLEKNKKRIYQRLISKYADTKEDTIKKESSKIGSFPLILKILEFGEDQIDMFLKKFNSQFTNNCKSDWQEVKSFLKSVYDISDLMKKPILLSMIKDTILDLGEEYKLKTENFDPVLLYEYYTKANLHREWKKGETRQLLTDEQRDKSAEVLAMLMFESNSLSISYNSLLSCIVENSELSFLNQLTDEEIASDLQICTFIQRTDDDQFKFIHKSFMEFYVARRLKNCFLKGKETVLNTKPIQKEILFFIGCYTFSNSKLKEKFAQIISSISQQRAIFKRNITIASLISSKLHENLLIKNVNANAVSLNNLKIIKGDFDNIIFDDCNLFDIQFLNCTLIIAPTNSILENLEFQNSHLDIKSNNTEYKDISIRECKKCNIFGKITFNSFNVINSDLMINSESYFNNNEVFYSNSHINISAKSTLFQNATIKNSIFKLDCADISIINSTLADNTIENLIIDIGKDNCYLNIKSSTLSDVKFSSKKGYYSLFIENSQFVRVHFDKIKIYLKEDYSIKEEMFEDCSGRIDFIVEKRNKMPKVFLKNKMKDKKEIKYNNKDSTKIEQLEIFIIEKC